MSARRAADAMAAGVLAALPDAVCDRAPMSDGGEGLVDAMLVALAARGVTATVTGPLGQPVDASYGYLDRDRLAIIEVAAAAGLGLLPPIRRDARLATTRGVGELIGHALDLGAERIVVGLGGTATNDAGAGMLQALGARLTDVAGRDLPPGGAELARLRAIDLSGLDPRLGSVRFELASDVTNVLLGEHGASRVFGPQKGASAAEVAELDSALATFAAVARRLLGRPIEDLPGAGAAGGLGSAFLGFLGAGFDRGVEVVGRAIRLEERIASADVVLTGEGSIDAQTLLGKVPLGVATLAARHNVPVIGFGGRIGGGAGKLLDRGFLALVPSTPRAVDPPTALREGPRNLERAVAEICGGLRRGRRGRDGRCAISVKWEPARPG
ncbi:MAG: glycerate kinase [Dactylosporangium sp.]|nr:glycerate kinase [Dactylosporangium sp.]